MEKNEKQLTPSDAKNIIKKIIAKRNKKAEYFQANGTLKGYKSIESLANNGASTTKMSVQQTLSMLDEIAGSVDRSIDYKKEREESRDIKF